MELTLVQSKIYEIRNQRVMLDFDLAAMYGIETRRLKEQVKRNIERFPEDFMFQTTKNEWKEVIANCDNLPEGVKYSPAQPFAFTQEGVAMLSGILRTPIAVQVNISIMRAFVAVRQLLANPPADKFSELQTEVRELKEYIEEVFTDYNDINEDTRMQLELINESLAELQANRTLSAKPRKPIGFITTKD